MVDTSEKEYKDQTLDEFEDKYINEQETNEVTRSTTENKIDYFIDTNGYTPEWAKNIGDQQILGKCNNLLMEQNPFKRSDDEKWCNEFGGYFMDYTDKEIEQMMDDFGMNLP